MTAEVEFQSGALGDPHSYKNVQTIFFASAKFRFTIEGKDVTVSAGESLIIASNVIHGCVALEDGKLIDSFTPCRDDIP